MATYAWQVPGDPSISLTPYATEDLCDFYAGGHDRLIQMINNADDPGGVLNPIAFLTAISGAQAIVDTYIGKQKAVPLAVCPPSVSHVTARIAVYHARASRGGIDPETHGKRYEDDMQFLKDIRDGAISLGTAVELPQAPQRLDGQYQVAPWKARSRKNLAGFG